MFFDYVFDHSYITGKYRGYVQMDCNINVKINHKLAFVFHSLKNYHPHLIMQKLGKFNFKMNVIPNGLQKLMSFNVNSKLILIAFNF